jgi:hypothetical protein
VAGIPVWLWLCCLVSAVILILLSLNRVTADPVQNSEPTNQEVHS